MTMLYTNGFLEVSRNKTHTVVSYGGNMGNTLEDVRKRFQEEIVESKQVPQAKDKQNKFKSLKVNKDVPF